MAGTGRGSSCSRAVSGMPKKKAASATRAAIPQNHEGCRIAEMVDDFTGDKATHRGADALAGGDSPLSQVVTAGAAHEVRQHERRKRSVDARTHAIHQLNENEPGAVI